MVPPLVDETAIAHVSRAQQTFEVPDEASEFDSTHPERVNRGNHACPHSTLIAVHAHA
jgi:hypothetical protein